MSGAPGTMEKTAADGGNQVSTTPVLKARLQDLDSAWPRARAPRVAVAGTAGEGARGSSAKAARSAMRCTNCGNMVSVIGRASSSPTWKPGFHGAWRSWMSPRRAGTISALRSIGNRGSTTPALLGRELPSPCARHRRVRAAACACARLTCSRRPTVRCGNGGNQVATADRASTIQAWKAGFGAAWHTQLLQLDAGPSSPRRNVGGNQVSTPMEV